MTEPKSAPLTSQEAWDNLWGPIVAPEGDLELDVVKALLHDYGVLLSHNMILFPYLTNNRITDPQHDLEEVIKIADECTADEVDSGIRQVLESFYDELQTVNTESEAVQLNALLRIINRTYERGIPDHE